MTLYEQLMYNWERGFYSVVKETYGGVFAIISTKDDMKSFRSSGWFANVEECKEMVGRLELDLTGYTTRIEVVDTIHPSELMGKGFQVGDRVLYNGEDVVVDYYFDHSQRHIFGLKKIGGESIFDGWRTAADVKPVLPVEEISSATKEAMELLKKHGYKIVKD